MEKRERFVEAYNYLKSKGLVHTQRDVAEKMKSSTSNVSSAFSGRETVLTDNFLRRFNKAYGNLFDNEWLVFGQGTMMAKKDNNEDPIRTLPLIPIDAMAGTLTEDNEGVPLERCERYQVPEFIDGGAQFLIRVSGDSMTPRYNNGDIVAVRRVEDVQFYQWGKIYVLDTNQGCIIKRVYEDLDDERNIICHSENDAVYADFAMPKTSVRGLFVIVGVIHTE